MSQLLIISHIFICSYIFIPLIVCLWRTLTYPGSLSVMYLESSLEFVKNFHQLHGEIRREYMLSSKILEGWGNSYQASPL